VLHQVLTRSQRCRLLQRLPLERRRKVLELEAKRLQGLDQEAKDWICWVSWISSSCDLCVGILWISSNALQDSSAHYVIGHFHISRAFNRWKDDILEPRRVSLGKFRRFTASQKRALECVEPRCVKEGQSCQSLTFGSHGVLCNHCTLYFSGPVVGWLEIPSLKSCC
jgi:hypothetical protein